MASPPEANAPVDVARELEQLPEGVPEFLRSLAAYAIDRSADQLRRLYEADFNQLTDVHFAQTRWPQPAVVDAYFKSVGMPHSLLNCLYMELYFRHVFAKCSPSVDAEDRGKSFGNYQALMNYFLEQELAVSAEHSNEGLLLPVEWVWDILDEYVYQFQESQHWRARGPRLPNMSEEGLKTFNTAWTPPEILQTLHLFVKLSGVREALRDGQDFSRRELPLRLQLGYFAMICLLRVNCLLGDYRAALDSVAGVDLSTNAFFWRVPACTVTLFYHVGFAYVMLRRYHDAIRVFSQILVFVSKTRSYLSSQSYQRDAMMKLADRMAMLAMLCASLASVRLDDSINQHLRDVCPDKFFKMQSDDEETFREVFLKAAPKFVVASTITLGPNAVVEEHLAEEPRARQLGLFMQSVRFQRKVGAVTSFAKLYNNLSLEKLATLMEVQPREEQFSAVQAVRAEILAVKNKGRHRVWHNGPLSTGKIVKNHSGVDFYIDNDLIHVQNLSTQRENYAEYLLEQIVRTQEMQTALANVNMNASPPAANE